MRARIILIALVTLLSSAKADSQFAFRIGDQSFDRGRAITSSPTGELFTTGQFALTADFDPGPDEALITSAGFFDGFIASYTSTGGYRWSFSLPVAQSSSNGQAITSTPTNQLLVSGTFSNSTDFDPDSTSEAILHAPCNESAAFVARYTNDGAYRWAFPLGGCTIDPFFPGSNDAWGLAATPDDGVLVTGNLRGDADLDPGPGEAPFFKAQGFAIFVASYDAGGAYRWGFQIGDDSSDDIGEGFAIASDASGGGVAVGNLRWPADFDPDPGSAAILTPISGGGRSDAFVASYDNTGAYRWAFNLGSPGVDAAARDVVFDMSENVYVTGDFQGPTDFDPDPNESFVLTPSVSFGNGFLASYNQNGGFRWAFAFPGSNGSEARSLAVDPTGDITVAGRIDGSIDFDPGPGEVVLTGTVDAFLASYMESGEYRWAVVLDSPDGYAEPRAIEAISEGRWVIAGDLYGTADFDPGPGEYLLTSVGQNDIFIASYADGGAFPVSSEPVSDLPTSFSLDRAYPNPFNPRATIPFALPEASRVTLTVYDVLGREITRLVDGRHEAGRHTATLDGSRLASGLYLVRILMEPEGGGAARAFVQRLTLLK